MSIQSFGYNFVPTKQLVNSSGIPFNDGRDYLLSLFNRTGGGTGIVPKVSGLFVATGNVLANSLQLTSDWNWVGTTAAGTGVQIPNLKPGNDIQVYNGGANALNVYPFGGASIDAGAINAPYVLASGKLRIFECWTLAQLFSFGS